MIITVGTIVDNKYEILEFLGRGGMGSVFKARQLGLDRHVAIKFCDLRTMQPLEAVNRFKRELDILKTLNHVNLASVYHCGQADGKLYLSMEYVQGSTLDSEICRSGRLSAERALRIVLQICTGLAVAHGKSIVHRDIKPGNVMIQQATPLSVKLIDFGLATIVNGGADRITGECVAVGTGHYMSPEQARGLEVDARTDIYAIGCLLYHCVTGALPHESENTVTTLYLQCERELPPLTQYIPQEPLLNELQSIIDKCTRKDRGERYADVASLLHEVEILTSEGTTTISLPKPTLVPNPPSLRLKSASIVGLVSLALAVAVLSVTGLRLLTHPNITPSTDYYRYALARKNANIGTVTNAKAFDGLTEEQLLKNALTRNDVDRLLEVNQVCAAWDRLCAIYRQQYKAKPEYAAAHAGLEYWRKHKVLPFHESYELANRLVTLGPGLNRFYGPIKDAEYVLQMRPAHPSDEAANRSLRLALSCCYFSAGRIDRAEQLLRDSDWRWKALTPRILQSQGTVALARGQLRLARTCFLESLALKDTDTDLGLLRLAHIAVYQDRLDDASDLLRKRVATTDTVEQSSCSALLKAKQGNFDEGEVELTQVLHWVKDHPGRLYNTMVFLDAPKFIAVVRSHGRADIGDRVEQLFSAVKEETLKSTKVL